jgi:hypothetical protein
MAALDGVRRTHLKIRALRSFYFEKKWLKVGNKSLQRLLFDAEHSTYGHSAEIRAPRSFYFEKK